MFYFWFWWNKWQAWSIAFDSLYPHSLSWNSSQDWTDLSGFPRLIFTSVILVCDNNKLSFSFETESEPGWCLSLLCCWEKSSWFYSTNLPPPVSWVKTHQEAKDVFPQGCCCPFKIPEVKGSRGQPKGTNAGEQGQPKHSISLRALSSVVNHLKPRFCSCYYHRIMLYVPMALLPDRNEQPVGRREHHPRGFVKWNSSAL